MVPYDIRGCLEGLALLVWKSRMALAISPLEQEILVTSPTCPAIFGRHTRLKLFGPNFFSDVSERLFLLHGTVATTSLKRIFFTSVESHEACSRACLMGGARSRTGAGMSKDERPVGSEAGHACFSASFTTDACSRRLSAKRARSWLYIGLAEALTTLSLRQPRGRRQTRPGAAATRSGARQARGDSRYGMPAGRARSRQHVPLS